eukprot:5870772-Prymnesium_polylepis.1
MRPATTPYLASIGLLEPSAVEQAVTGRRLQYDEQSPPARAPPARLGVRMEHDLAASLELHPAT